MRTFIAIELPVAVREQIRAVQMQLQSHLHDLQIANCFRWMPPEKVHLTLRFLGETDQHQHCLIAQGMGQLVSGQKPFVLALNGVGCFPNSRAPSVVWLGLQGDLDRLAQVQALIEHLARQAGFPPERRSFSPHLTIARTQRDADRTHLAQAARALQTLPVEIPPERSAFIVDEVVHMQSELLPGGARYILLEYFEFRGSKTIE